MVSNYANKDYKDVQSTIQQNARHTESWSAPLPASRQCIIKPFREPPFLVHFCYNICRRSHPSQSTPKCVKEPFSTYCQRHHGSNSENAVSHLNLEFQLSTNPYAKQNIYNTCISSFRQPYDVPVVRTSKKLHKEGAGMVIEQMIQPSTMLSRLTH